MVMGKLLMISGIDCSVHDDPLICMWLIIHLHACRLHSWWGCMDTNAKIDGKGVQPWHTQAALRLFGVDVVTCQVESNLIG